MRTPLGVHCLKGAGNTQRISAALGLVCLCAIVSTTSIPRGQSRRPIVGWGETVVVEQFDLEDLVAVPGGWWHSLGLKSSSTRDVEEPGPGAVPGAAMLAIVSLAPNPFNPSTEVYFETRGSGHVTMEIHDVSGRRVRTVRLGYVAPGLHQAQWDGRDASGDNVSSGVYFVRLRRSEGESRPVKVGLDS